MNNQFNKIDVNTSEILTKLDKAVEALANVTIPADIPHGDMPGDKIEIGDSHTAKAKTIFPSLVKELKETMSKNP